LLTGDSHSGRSARDDFLNMFIAGISALGCAPESDANVTVDITPIDYAAKAMAHIVLESLTYKGSFTYHIANDRSLALNDLIRYIRDSGVDIKIVTAPQFLSRLREKAGKITTAESAACLALCRSLGADESFERFRTMDLFQATDIRFDCRNTLSALEGTPISCPAPDAHLIQKYIAGVVKGSVIARDS
jgi:thioester reductase-like protein